MKYIQEKASATSMTIVFYNAPSHVHYENVESMGNPERSRVINVMLVLETRGKSLNCM